MAEYLLEMKQIVKQFPGTLALDHVDFTLEQGEVMALIGENGAGKSTLMNVLMGMLQPDSGEMVLRGETITNRSPYEALQKGIGMVPQELNLVSDLKSRHIVRPVSDEVFLKVIGLCRGREFQNVDFEVKKGEIFGVAGLVGAGRTELFSCLYGLTKKEKGKVYLEGKEVEITSPDEAISYGIGLVPEERRKQGMFPILSIYENIMMPNYHKITRMGRINFSQARDAANRHIQALRIKTPDCLTQIKNLSGGNQQKVILGRWMEKQVKLFILDEPTRGIDVRAKGEIYKLIRDMADSGITIIVISSEIEELLTLADRIMIMNGGKVKGVVVPNEDMEREDILKVALH